MIKPSFEEVRAYFVEKKELRDDDARIEARKLIDYYDSVEWTYSNGKKKIKDWRRAASGWVSRLVSSGRISLRKKYKPINNSLDVDF